MTSNDLTLHPDQTFRRVWTSLMALYVAAVLLLQFKGEALRPKEVIPSAADEPPRIARILPAPVDAPPPAASIAAPPAAAEKVLPPPPVQEAREEAGPQLKKEEKPELKVEVKKAVPPASLPIAPPKRSAEKVARAEKPPVPQPLSRTEPLSSAPTGPSGSPTMESPVRPAPKEEVKKVGLLGLLGGGKGKESDPSLGRSFSSLKELPSPSALPSAPAASSPTLSAREKKGTVPAPPISPEALEQLRKETVEAEEKGLVQTRKAAIEENLSDVRATSEGVELNHSAISEIADQHKEKLLQLYSRRLHQKPNIKGSVTVEFVISPEGKVLKCHILSTSLSDPVFENEIVKEILQWKFPPGAKGATTVLYPVSFFPAG